jgi:hypothetical protein
MHIETANQKELNFPPTTILFPETLKKLGMLLAEHFKVEVLEGFKAHVKEFNSVIAPVLSDLKKEYADKDFQKINEVFVKALLNKPTELKSFSENTTSRIEKFIYAVQQVEDYPLSNVANWLNQQFDSNNIDKSHTNKFIVKFKKSIIKLMIDSYMDYEEAVFDILVDEELKNLKVDYLIENKALQYLEPHKYKFYLDCLYKGFNALYFDMQSYTDFSNPLFEGAERLFKNLIDKLHKAAGKEHPEITTPTTVNFTKESKNYPTHIFRRYDDFQLFDAVMQHDPNADEIGFLFRTMSEQETPAAIVVKETPFRTWFNQESGYKMELNNPIKTLSRIKDHSGKQLKYKLHKELLQTAVSQIN